MAIRLKNNKIGVTPRELLGAKLFNDLEDALRTHLRNIGDPPKPGEFPALIFGRMPEGSVVKVKFPAEFQ